MRDDRTKKSHEWAVTESSDLNPKTKLVYK